MKRNRIALVASAALLLASAAPSFAQMTVENVDPTDPFGEINVDIAGGDVAGMTASMEEAQLSELNERCELMIGTPIPYTEEDLQFCITLLGRDNEGMTATGLKEAAAAADGEKLDPAGAAAAGATEPAAEPEADEPVEGAPEGNQ